MASLPPKRSAAHPLHHNPHHLPAQTSFVTRLELLLDSASSPFDDEHAGKEGLEKQEEEEEEEEDGGNDEAEALLLELLRGTWKDVGVGQGSKKGDAEDIVMEDERKKERKKRTAEESEGGSAGVEGSDEDADDREAYDFRLLSTQPVKKICLEPLIIHWTVDNPNHVDLSEQAELELKLRAAQSSVTVKELLAAARIPDAPPPKPSVPYQTTSTSSSSEQPTLLLTTAPRPLKNPRTAHFAPQPPPERGPDGHLPCLQLPVEPRSPSFTVTSSSCPSLPGTNPAPPLRKRPRRKHVPKAASPLAPAFYHPPSSSLGGKSLGYAYGYSLGLDSLPGSYADNRDVYLRDRMKVGWQGEEGVRGGEDGEGWWGAKKSGRDWKNRGGRGGKVNIGRRGGGSGGGRGRGR